jgi:hypothetical protein
MDYFRRVSQRVRSLVSLKSRVFVWGGNVIPLVMSGRQSVSRFPSARFITPPYATPELQKEFLRIFEQEKPELILDLHERGDNQFNLPLSSFLEMENLVREQYEAWLDPALPWVIYFIRKGLLNRYQMHLQGLCEGSIHDSNISPFPKSIKKVEDFVRRVQASSGERWDVIRAWSSWDRILRTSFALEWSQLACRARTNLEETQQDSRFAAPWVLNFPFWWASLAVVEFQPVIVPRKR